VAGVPTSVLARIAHAADTHAWDISVLEDRSAVMATRDSGRIGEPWVVLASSSGPRLRVSLYQPGDALDAPGESVAELAGNPRELGRQLRQLLEELATDDAS
jgi:hypothetical protein